MIQSRFIHDTQRHAFSPFSLFHSVLNPNKFVIFFPKPTSLFSSRNYWQTTNIQRQFTILTIFVYVTRSLIFTTMSLQSLKRFSSISETKKFRKNPNWAVIDINQNSVESSLATELMKNVVNKLFVAC